MFKNLLHKNFMVLLAIAMGGGTISAQTKQDDTSTKVNFRYSQNPKSKAKTQTADQKKASESSSDKDNTGNTETPENAQAVAEKQPESKPEREKSPETQVELQANSKEKPAEVVEKSIDDSRSIASKTMEIAKRASKAAISPTEVYKVGVGDVLFINLQNAPSGTTNYFTVLNDGTIDFPIVTGSVPVQGLTTSEIEEFLQANIKIVENPKVAVRIREHASHSISVLGLVEKPGVKLLQREAVPLFVVRAEAIVKSNANRVIIRRTNSTTEKFDLNSESYESVLIFPGDIIEFVNFIDPLPILKVPQFYYIGGNIRTIGQKDFYAGLTLSQAILASGGLKKGKDILVVVRRKNTEGLLESKVYDLNQIKDGKIPDPTLEAGDTIEVGS
jgi:protein involved in polysaccharide export with SLBB domain